MWREAAGRWLNYEGRTARKQHRWRDHRNAANHSRGRRPVAFKKGVCLGWGAHPAQSLTLSLCSLSATIATWHLVHHQERMAYPIRKTCDLRIFPIEMILNKYFLEETPRDESKRTISTGTDKCPFICSATACDCHGMHLSIVFHH